MMTSIPPEVSVLVVIDPRVEDHLSLAAGVIPQAVVSILDPSKDGIEQITRVISETSADSLHIISHGSPGCLNLGNSQLSLETLENFAHKLRTWQVPSLFLYGCNVAAGDAGSEFISQIRHLTGANVAASTTPVGNSKLGGNWNLDYALGTVDSQVAISPKTQANFAGVLVTNTDGDSITEDILDFDDDNDGIPDAEEGLVFQTITLNQTSAIPTGTIPGDPAGVRISDSTGQFALDLFVGPNTDPGASFSVNTNTGRISSNGANLSGEPFGEVAEIVYTTANSPTPFLLSTLQILDVDSLSTAANGISFFRDAYVFSESGTFTPLGTGGFASPAGAVVSVDPTAPDGIGDIVIPDPDNPALSTDIIDSFSQVLDIDNTLSDVLLNLTGPINNHNVEFTFDNPQETASLFVFNSGSGSVIWAFSPQLDLTIQTSSGIDTDGDGIDDHLDLDSDNDGISDLIEGGLDATVVDLDNNGVVDGGVDIAGIPVAANGGVNPTDSDGDGIDDFRDLDSDGDTIPDTIELRASTDFVANDGDVSNDDSDGDGIIDEFDGVGGHGGAFDVPVNTDGINTIPDFLDTDSDGDGILDSAEAGPIATPPSFTDPDGSVNAPLGNADGLLNVDLDPDDVDFRSLNLDVTAPTAPTVTIDEDLNDDGFINDAELDGDVDVTVGLPADAVAGDTLAISDGTTPQTIILDADDIAAGEVTATVAAPADGTDLTVTANITDAAGNTSADGGDASTIDTTALAPTVTIEEDFDDDGFITPAELDGDVNVTVGLPADVVAGDTLVVTDGITPQTIVLSSGDIAAGTVAVQLLQHL